MSVFDKGKSLDEIEQETEEADAKLTLARKKALLKKAEGRYGKGGWKIFSRNGFMSGIDWEQMKFKLH